MVDPGSSQKGALCSAYMSCAQLSGKARQTHKFKKVKHGPTIAMKNVNKHIQGEARHSWHPLSHGTTNLHNQPEQSTCTMDNQLAQSTCTCTRNLHKQCAALSGGRRHSCQCHPRTHRSQAWPDHYRKARYNADFDVGGTMANTCPMRTGASRHAPRDPVGSFAWASSCSVLLKSTNDKHKGAHKHNAHGHGHVEHHNELLDQSMTISQQAC